MPAKSKAQQKYMGLAYALKKGAAVLARFKLRSHFAVFRAIYFFHRFIILILFYSG